MPKIHFIRSQVKFLKVFAQKCSKKEELVLPVSDCRRLCEGMHIMCVCAFVCVCLCMFVYAQRCGRKASSSELQRGGEGLSVVKLLVEQKLQVERELGELRMQLEKTGFSSLSQIR